MSADAKGRISIADLETAIDAKANKICPTRADPETGRFSRTIAFDLKNPIPLPDRNAVVKK